MRRFPDLNHYVALGMQLVEPTEHPEAKRLLAEAELGAGRHLPRRPDPVGRAGRHLEDRMAQMPPTAEQLPAIQAGQMIAWPAASALGYGNAAAVLSSLADSVAAADENVV